MKKLLLSLTLVALLAGCGRFSISPPCETSGGETSGSCSSGYHR